MRFLVADQCLPESGNADTEIINSHHVLLADMSSIGKELLVSDGTHPNDFGYQKMAQIWYDAIKSIPDGWIKAPGRSLVP